MFDDNKRRKIYDALSNDYDMPSYEQFSQDMADEGKRRKMYDAMSQDYDMPSFEAFTQDVTDTQPAPAATSGVQGAAVNPAVYGTPTTQAGTYADPDGGAVRSVRKPTTPAPQQPTAPSETTTPTTFTPSPVTQARRGRYPGDTGIVSDPASIISGEAQQEQNRRTAQQYVQQAVPYVQPAETRQAVVDRATEEMAEEMGTAEDWVRRHDEAESAQMQNISDQVDSMLVNVEQMRDARLQKLAKEYKARHGKRSVFDIYNVASTPGTTQNTAANPDQEAAMNDLQLGVLSAAQRKLKSAQNTIAEAQKHRDDPRWLAEFGRGLSHGLTDISTWDFGITDLANAKAIQSALEKADNGEQLTDAEQALLDAVATEVIVNEYFGSDVSNWYKGGNSTAVSIPFMASMIISPAMSVGRGASAAMARYITKRFASQVAKKGIKKVVTRVAEGALKGGSRLAIDATAAAAHTAMFDPIRIEADTKDRMMGDIVPTFDSNGNIIYGGHKDGIGEAEARGKAFLNYFTENFSEMVGDYIPGMKTIFGNAKWAKKFMGNKFVHGIANMESRAQFHGFIPEMIEEIVNGGMNAWLVGNQTLDANPETGVFSKDNLATTAISIGATSLSMGLLKLGGYGVSRSMLRKSDRQAAQLFGDEWAGLRERLRSDNLADVEAFANEISQSDQYSDEQKKAAIKYATIYAGINAYAHMDKSPEQSSEDNNYDVGYEQAVTPQTREEIAAMYDEARSRLNSLVDEQTMQMLDSEEYGADVYNSLSDDAKAAYSEYRQMKAAMEGVQQRISDDAEDYAAQLAEENKPMQFRGEGENQGALRPMKVNIPGVGVRDVYLTQGEIALTDSGLIDPEKTKEVNNVGTLTAYDPQAGREVSFAPSDIVEVGQMVTAEQQAADIAAKVQAFVQQQTDEMNGKLNPKVGDMVVVPDGGTGEVMDIGDDGEYLVALHRDEEGEIDASGFFSLDELQQAADARRGRRSGQSGNMPQAQRSGNMPPAASNAQPAAVGEISQTPQAQTVQGAPETFTPGMVMTLEDEDGNSQQVTVKGMARYVHDENGWHYEPDPNGTWIEYQDAEGNTLHEEPQYLKAKVTGYQMPQVEEQPTEEQPTTPTMEQTETAAPTAVPTETTTQTETPAPNEATTETASEIVSDNSVAMPMRTVTVGKGKNAKQENAPDWYAVTPERTHAYIYNELGFTPKEADGTVTANVKAVADAINQHMKVEPKPGANPLAYKSAHDAWAQQLQDMQAQADYWRQVQSIRNQQVLAEAAARDEAEREERERRRAETEAARQREQQAYEAEMARRRAEQERQQREADERARQAEEEMRNVSPEAALGIDTTADNSAAERRQQAIASQRTRAGKIAKAEELYEGLFNADFAHPQDVTELVAMNMPKEKINWSDVNGQNGLQSEMGSNMRYGRGGDLEGFGDYIINNGTGLSVEETVNRIYRSEMNNPVGSSYPLYEAQDIKDALIGLMGSVGSGKEIADYALNSRLRYAESEMQARERAAMERYVDEEIQRRTGLTPAEYEAWLKDMYAKAVAVADMSEEEYNNLILQEYDTGTETNDERGGETGADALPGAAAEAVAAGTEENGAGGVEGVAGQPAVTAEQPAGEVDGLISELVAADEKERAAAGKPGYNEAYNEKAALADRVLQVAPSLSQEDLLKIQKVATERGMHAVAAHVENELLRRKEQSKQQKTDGNATKTSKRDKALLEVVMDKLRNIIGDRLHTTLTEDEKRLINWARAAYHSVFHGSGADFERFDSSHMGEGEGAQAYGYGHYTTEVEGIGRTYAESIAGKAVYKGKPVVSDPYSDNPADRALFYMEQEKGRENAIKFLKGLIKDEEDADTIKEYEDTIKALQDEKSWSEPDRVLYTVEIPDDNGSNYLEWDGKIGQEVCDKVAEKLLSEDYVEAFGTNWPTYKKNGKRIVLNPNAKGEDLYAELSTALGSDKAASEFLHDMGYVGIKYPAQYRSGGREDNAKNYAIFDDGDLKIIDKVKFFKTPQGEVYGFTVGGNIYVDMDIAKADTPIHEYGHLWVPMVRESDPEMWEDIKSVLTKDKDVKPFMDIVRQRYPELTAEGREDDFMEEVFTHFSGDNGLTMLEEAAREYEEKDGQGFISKAKAIAALNKVKEALDKFWGKVAQLFGIKFRNARDVANKMLKDFMDEVDPTKVRRESEENEMQEIERKAKADGTWMKAPNGKPSRLNEKQWVTVRTKAFKNWFGDWENDPENASKVVDENGEPLVVYHGTPYGFTEFRENENGIFFSSIDRASWYVKGDDSPSVKKFLKPFESWEEVEAFANKYHMTFEKADPEEYDDGYIINGEFVDNLNDATDIAQEERDNVLGEGGMIPVFLNIRNPRRIDAKGRYAININQTRNRKSQDGVIVENVNDPTFDEGSDFEDTNYVVYQPNQIKSATSNAGTFNSRNADIRFQKSEEPQPIGRGAFGDIYDQFKGKAKEAIDFLLRKKGGEAIGALHHKEIGDIDLVWGEEGTGKSDGYGLAKLAKYHPEVLDNLQEILDDMHVTTRSENRVQLESDTHQATVRLTWDNQKKTWLLTAFEKKNSALDNTTDTGKTPNGGKRNDTATPQSTVSAAKVQQNSETAKNNLQNAENYDVRSEVEPYKAPKKNEGEDFIEYAKRVAKDYAEYSRKKQAAEENKGEAEQMKADYKAIGGKLSDLRKAMSLQKEFDKATVKRVSDLAREFIDKGLMDDMTAGAVSRLLAACNSAVGKADISKELNTVMDIMVDSQLKRAEETMRKLESTRGNRLDSRGVVVGAKLDPAGQQYLKAFKEAKELSEDELEQKISEYMNDMTDPNPAIAEEAAWKASAYKRALDYVQTIKQSKKDEADLKEALRKEEMRVYDVTEVPLTDEQGNVLLNKDGEPRTRKVRHVKAEFKPGKDANGETVPVSEEKKREREQVKQAVAAIEEAIMKLKTDRLEAYSRINAGLSGSLTDSMEKAKEHRDEELAMVNDIHHAANSDMKGTPRTSNFEEPKKIAGINNFASNTLFAPLKSFMEYLRLFGQKSPNGEGNLYDMFGRGWVDARDKEIEGVEKRMETLDNKAKELFGDERYSMVKPFNGKNALEWHKVDSWGDLIRYSGSLPKGNIPFYEEMTDEDGNPVRVMRDHEATQGMLMYVYMVDKMTDGRMKLRKMGITDDVVEDITRQLDPRFRELADWMQQEFLPENRKEYNETYRRMFGASMPEVENYFPLRVNPNDRTVKPDELDQGKKKTIDETTGAVKKRTVNTLGLNLLHADALQVLLDNVLEMEHWNAFAEYNKKLNILRTYKPFKNQVFNMKSLFGSNKMNDKGEIGSEIWDGFNAAAQMAVGDYSPNTSKHDKAMLKAIKGVTAARVTARIFTAFKQLESILAYIPYVRFDDFMKSSFNIMKDESGKLQHEAWKWCMDNLPIVRDRWKSRVAGDPRLAETTLNWQNFNNNVKDLAARYGMTPNAFVDEVAVCIGAKAVYETQKRRYLKEGYPEETADRKAKQDAEIIPNATQQSSEGAFLSTLQTDRTWMDVVFSIFRNANFSYQRRLHTAARGLKNNMTEEQRKKSIEFERKKMVRQGVPEEKAQEAAEKHVNRELRKNALEIATFAFIIQAGWYIISQAPYLISGGDDDKKKKAWNNILIKTLFGWTEGLMGGDVINTALSMPFTKEGKVDYLKKEMPAADEIIKFVEKVYGGRYAEALNDIIVLGIELGLGVDPHTITDWVMSIDDACNGDLGLGREAVLATWRFINAPQSQTDDMYFDEFGMTGKEARQQDYDKLVKRYIDYKIKREYPFTHRILSDEEREKLEKNYKKRASGYVKERTGRTIAEQQAYDKKRHRDIFVPGADQTVENDYDALADTYDALKKADYKKNYAKILNLQSAYEQALRRDLVEAAKIKVQLDNERAIFNDENPELANFMDYGGMENGDLLRWDTYIRFENMEKILKKQADTYRKGGTPEQRRILPGEIALRKKWMVKILTTPDIEERNKLAQQMAEEIRQYQESMRQQSK